MDFKQFYKTINFDIDNEIRTVFQATQGDTKSRGLLVDLIVGGVKTPVTTETIRFFALKPDGTRVVTQGVKDGTGFRIDFTNQTFAVPGVLLCTLVLSGTNGEKIADKKFKMNVDSTLEDGAIISEDERGILDRAFDLANDIVPRLEGLDVPLLENLEQRIDNIIATPVPTGEVIAQEIIDARQGEVSVGANITEVKSQLAQSTKLNNLKNDFVEYGELKLPPEIPSLPFSVYRDNDGLIKNTFDKDKLYIGAGNVYVDYINGWEGRDGLSKEQAVRRFDEALSIADSLPNDRVVVHFLNQNFPSNFFLTPTTYQKDLSKNIILKAGHDSGRCFVHSGRPDSTYNWTKDGVAYKASRSAVTRVLDSHYLDFRNLPIELKEVSNVNELEKGTWYTDGSEVWVRRFDDQEPDEDLILHLSYGYPPTFNIANYKFVLDGVNFLWYSSGGDSLKVTGNAQSEFYHINSAFCYSKVGNGLSIVSVGKVYGFNSTAKNNFLDGFNYHGNGYEFIFEYQCLGYESGDGTKGTSNATTAHDGMTVLRLGSVGYNTYGPVLADVNGCFSYNIDCVMYDSLLSSGIYNAAFVFNDSLADKNGVAYLINCQGGGKGNTYTVNTDGVTQLFIKNLRGNNIPSDLKYSLIE